jgi:hypothetical protein
MIESAMVTMATELFCLNKLLENLRYFHVVFVSVDLRVKRFKVIVHFNYIWNFRFFLARHPQGVLDRFPPFKPCANAFFHKV